jgi:hypothetical protein
MDGVILTLAYEGPLLDGVIHSSETLVWMFCGLGNAVKDYVVISWPCTKGIMHWAKWRLLVA